MRQRLLLIEDDQRLANMLLPFLDQHGYQVAHAATANAGLALLENRTEHFDLLLLDLMLPDAFGLDVCRQIRAQASAAAAIPIIMLTAKGDPMDKVLGLEIGADDYVAKPFEPRELLARLRALLRRQTVLATHASPNRANSNILRFGRLEINLDAHALYVDAEECSLTAYQFDLLVAMAKSAGRVVSREYLKDAVKGELPDAFDRSIDVHIGKIRAAIEDDPKQPKRIITVRGAGYVFAKVQDA
jgi:DNA-binding response OmpR family regulator